MSWPERAVFVALCVATAASPMLAHLAIHVRPGVGPEPWYDSGIYVSWAFLIYFSWSFLPRLSLPAAQGISSTRARVAGSPSR